MNKETIEGNLYINSGVSWLGEIPKNWKISKVKYEFRISNLKSKDEDPVVLSLARDGVKVRDITTNEGQLATSYLNYNIVQPNDLLLNPMDLISGANCSLSKVSGVISPAYINLKAKNGNDPRYFDYYFKVQYWLMAFFSCGKGVSYDNRWTMNSQTLLNYPLLVPPLEEQKRIADFIDYKCNQIDDIIDGLKQKSNSLQEYKKAITKELVTKGINNTNFVDSGVHWIGTIPENWNMIPNKYLFKEMTKKVGSKWEQTQLLSLTTNGIKEKGFDEIGGKMPESYDNYLEVRKGQLVMCLFDLDVSAVFSGLSPYDGMITSAYHVYEGSDKIDMRYVDYFFKFVFDNRNYKLYSKSLRYTISSDGFNNIKTPVPPLEEQKQIADYLDDQYKKINDISDGIKEEIRILEDYKKSLIYEYVTGKKVVKDE